jgi:hypothetical protein
MLDPQGINNLEQVVEIEGLLNCKVSYAINVVAPEAAIKKSSLNNTGSSTFVQVVWEKLTPEQRVNLLHGFYWMWMIRHILGPKVKRRLAKLVSMKEEIKKKENKSAAHLKDLEGVKWSVELQREVVQSVCLWLFHFYSQGTCLTDIPDTV